MRVLLSGAPTTTLGQPVDLDRLRRVRIEMRSSAAGRLDRYDPDDGAWKGGVGAHPRAASLCGGGAGVRPSESTGLIEQARPLGPRPVLTPARPAPGRERVARSPPP